MTAEQGLARSTFIFLQPQKKFPGGPRRKRRSASLLVRLREGSSPAAPRCRPAPSPHRRRAGKAEIPKDYHRSPRILKLLEINRRTSTASAPSQGGNSPFPWHTDTGEQITWDIKFASQQMHNRTNQVKEPFNAIKTTQAISATKAKSSSDHMWRNSVIEWNLHYATLVTFHCI